MRIKLVLIVILGILVTSSCISAPNEGVDTSSNVSSVSSSLEIDNTNIIFTPEYLQTIELQYPFFSMGGAQYVEEYMSGFFCVPVSGADHVYYADLNTGVQAVFCGNPSCRHQPNEGCVGYYGFAVPGSLQVYNNRLYCWGSLDSANELFETEIDGSKKTNKGPLVTADGRSQAVGQCGIVNDCVYTLSVTGVDREGHQLYTIFRRELNGSGNAEVVYQTAEDDGWSEHSIDDFRVGNEGVWFCVHKYRENPVSSSREIVTEIYRYSFDHESIQLCMDYEGFIAYTVVDGDIYYSIYDWDNGEYLPGIYKVGKNGTDILVADDGGLMSYDGSYIYVQSMNRNGVRIYDRNGTLVTEHTAQTLSGRYSVFTTQNLVMYLGQNIEQGNLSDVFEVWYKKDIVEGTGEGHRFEFRMFPYDEE